MINAATATAAPVRRQQRLVREACAAIDESQRDTVALCNCPRSIRSYLEGDRGLLMVAGVRSGRGDTCLVDVGLQTRG